VKCPKCGDDLMQYVDRVWTDDKNCSSEIVTCCVNLECDHEERRPFVKGED
jgi:hypothetical protein